MQFKGTIISIPMKWINFLKCLDKYASERFAKMIHVTYLCKNYFVILGNKPEQEKCYVNIDKAILYTGKNPKQTMI